MDKLLRFLYRRIIPRIQWRHFVEIIYYFSSSTKPKCAFTKSAIVSPPSPSPQPHTSSSATLNSPHPGPTFPSHVALSTAAASASPP